MIDNVLKIENYHSMNLEVFPYNI